MLSDFGQYLKAVLMSWFQSYSCVTAVPEIVNRLAPDRFAKWVAMLDRYVCPQIQYSFVLGIAIAGFFLATFVAWRKEHRLIGLRGSLQQIHCAALMDGRKGTRVTVVVNIFNSGPPSVATDWKLLIRRKLIVRAVERNFHSNGKTLDPQKIPIEEGAHIFGTLIFIANMPLTELERYKKHWRITFQDAARRSLRLARVA